MLLCVSQLFDNKINVRMNKLYRYYSESNVLNRPNIKADADTVPPSEIIQFYIDIGKTQ